MDSKVGSGVWLFETQADDVGRPLDLLSVASLFLALSGSKLESGKHVFVGQCSGHALGKPLEVSERDESLERVRNSVLGVSNLLEDVPCIRK